MIKAYILAEEGEIMFSGRGSNLKKLAVFPYFSKDGIRHYAYSLFVIYCVKSTCVTNVAKIRKYKKIQMEEL